MKRMSLQEAILVLFITTRTTVVKKEGKTYVAYKDDEQVSSWYSGSKLVEYAKNLRELNEDLVSQAYDRYLSALYTPKTNIWAQTSWNYHESERLAKQDPSVDAWINDCEERFS